MKISIILLLSLMLISFTSALNVNIPTPLNLTGVILNASSNDSYFLRGQTPQQVANLYTETDPTFTSWLSTTFSSAVNSLISLFYTNNNLFNGTGTGLQSSGNTVSANISYFDSRYASGSNVYYFTNTSSPDISGYFIMNSTLPQTTSQRTYEKEGVTDNQILISWANSNSNITFIPAGVIHSHLHLDKTLGAMDLQVYGELYKNSSGTETLIATTETSNILPLGSEQDTDLHAVINDTILLVTDRLVFKLRATVTGIGIAPNIQIYTEGQTASRLELPFAQGTIAVNEVDPLSLHLDGSTPLTGNINMNQYNVTNVSYIKLNFGCIYSNSTGIIIQQTC